MVCDRDCFNCKYPDCVQEKMTHEERKEILERDKKRNLITTKKSDKENSYYALHREERIAYQRKYYREHSKEVNEYRYRYEKAHREEINERKRIRYAERKLRNESKSSIG